MKKFLALISARNKEFYRDRTAMSWTLLFPFIVLTGFAYGYSGKEQPLLRVTAVPASALEEPLISDLKNTAAVELSVTDDAQGATRKLERYETDLLIRVEHGSSHIAYALNPDSSKGKLLETLLLEKRQALTGVKPAISVETVQGKKIRYADWLLPGLLAMNIMFGSMFGVGYVIVRYRKNGVLKRLRATPLSAFQFLTAQVISRMLLMLLTAFIVILGARLLIGFKSYGSMFDLAVFLAVSSAAMISLGLVVAARISSEEVADGVLNLMTWPMIFLSGIWFSIDGASSWVIFGAKLMPLTHVVAGLRAIMIEGAGLSQVLPEMAVLVGLSAVFIAFASLIFRWR